ncbi:MAG: diacylglycerol kinase family protein [Proteobacteria bacterium]|nr:diacylglycerol kinase family protein [Pseudomonadota bacterium]
MRAVAIINANARGLTRRTRAAFSRAMRVHYTRSLVEARTIVRDEIKRGVDLVVLGGGDGTFVMTLALIAEACRGEGRPEPAIGMVRLGSGNALATTLGASDDPARDLAQFAQGKATWHPRRMIEVVGLRAPFVGVGLDALVLEDQAAIGRVVDRVPGGRLLGGTARYALSVALRSIPRFTFTDRVRVTVTNLGSPVVEMRPHGPISRTIPAGSVIWSGACTLVAAGTIPYFGFGLKMFPFADRREDRYHLRCGDPGMLEVLRNTPAAFRGDYFSDRVRDFLCDRIAIEVADSDDHSGISVEAGGELIERRPRVELGLSPPVMLATLADPR